MVETGTRLAQLGVTARGDGTVAGLRSAVTSEVAPLTARTPTVQSVSIASQNASRKRPGAFPLIMVLWL